MKKSFYSLILISFLAIIVSFGCGKKQHSPAPVTQSNKFPALYTHQGFGVNFHHNSYTIEDLDLIKAAGFKLIRTDFLWHNIEKEKGVYDFNVFDQLLPELTKRDLRAILILDYGNPLYNTTYSISTDSARQAFKNFAAAAAARYQSHRVIWEIWNEPDCVYFWNPQPSIDDYMNLVKTVIPAIKEADPKAVVIAPAVGELFAPYTFLKDCFQRGLLNLVDAVSVHPYRPFPPESVVTDYANLRNLIKKYDSQKADLPIISGEWGYSSAEEGSNESIQAKYLMRMFLINLSQGISVSIWYDWRNDGPSPSDRDHNWGLITFTESLPKKSHQAFQTMITQLAKATFVKRLSYPADPEVYLLQFNRTDSTKKLIIAWTTKPEKDLPLANGTTLALTDTPAFFEFDSVPEF